jgi:hypothetical protein
MNKSYFSHLIRRLSEANVQLVVLLAILLSGCDELGETFTDLASLQNDIENQYGDDGNLSVQYSVATGVGRAVKIEWENSTTFSPDDSEIEEKTEELAHFVYEHYNGKDKIDNVWIILIESRNYFVINSTHTVPFIYDVDDLANNEETE